ncbi:MAG: hypothetical protein ACYDA3_12860 [Gaiellaceae bacterium]
MGVAARILSAKGVREARLFASLARSQRPLATSAPGLYVRGVRAMRRRTVAPSGRVLVVARATAWLRLALALAPVLHARGSDVDLLVVPFGERNAPIFADDFYRLGLLRRALGRVRGFRLLFSSEIGGAELADDARRIVEEQSLLDAKLLLGRESIDDSNSTHVALLAARRELNAQAARAVETLLAEREYDAVLVANGAQFELGTAFRLAGIRAVRRVAFEFSELRDHAVVTLDATLEHMPVEPYWEADEPHALTTDRRERVARFVAERETMDWTSLMQTLQYAPTAPVRDVANLVGLREGAPTALLVSNLVSEAYYISHFVDRSTLAFDTMSDWIVETIRLFALRPEWDLVVRAHPWERKQTGIVTVEEVLADAFSELPGNVHLVRPTDPVNTYSLMALADIGIAYVSTAGLELAVRGIPVVTAGSPHFARKGFTFDPPTRPDYDRVVGELLDDPQRLDARRIELAWCYLDVAFFGFPRPFPWVPLHFDQDYIRRPLDECISPEGERLWGETFDLMRGVGWDVERRVPEGWRTEAQLAASAVG